MISRLLGVSTTSLRWDALPPLWVVVLVLIPIVSLTVRFVYRREPGAQSTALRMGLGLLRVLAVLLVMGAFFGPYAETIEGEVAKRTLVLAVDTSRSMSLQDRYQRNTELADAVAQTIGTSRDKVAQLPRIEIARRLIGQDPAFLRSLAETFNLQLYTFDSQATPAFTASDNETPDETAVRLTEALNSVDANGRVTRIGEAIQTLVRRLESRNEPVAGVFLFTDGRQTGGAPDPIVAARNAGERGREGIPLFPVPIGDPAAAINVGVSRVDAPEVVLAGDRTSFTATVHARGCEGRDAQLEAHIVDTEGRVLESLPIDAEPFALPGDDDEPHRVSFNYTFLDKGTYDLRIGVAPLPGEAVVSDNYRHLSIRVVELKMRVLFVADRPSYTFRFLGQALRRADKTIIAQTLLLSAEPSWPQESTIGIPSIQHFPETRAELAPYDVIILQDVKPGSARFADGGPEGAQKTMALLADWVKDGGGLVLQSGRDMNFVTRYGNTELPALLPVVPGRWTLDERDGVMGDNASRKYLDLTENGAAHPIMRVLEGADRVREFWESPEYENWCYAYTPVKHAKSSANVLAVRREAGGRALRSGEAHPMIALQDYGLGKVLWLAHEEFFRMRKRQDDDPNIYYWRFWSGIVRHLATYRLLGGNKRIKIWVDRADGRYKLDDAVSIEAKFLDEDFNPVSPDGPEGESRTVNLIEPDGKERELQLTADRTDPPEGLYRTSLTLDRPGTYRLVASLPGDTEPAKATFVIEETTLEMRDPLVDLRTLQGIAQASRGRVLSPSQFRRLIEDRVVPPTTIVRSGEATRTPLWDRSWVLWLFVALLAAEWIVRRLNHML